MLVRKRGNQNTTERIKQHIAKHKHIRFAVATNILDDELPPLCGVRAEEDMPQRIPSIAFRLGEKIQPVLIFYNHLRFVPNTRWSFIKYLMLQSEIVKPYVFMLPAVDPSDFATVEECVRRVRNGMDWVLKKYAFLCKNNRIV